MSRVWEAPSISWSPFQITPKINERVELRRKKHIWMENWNVNDNNDDRELPSQSKRKASTESNRSLKLWAERDCDELIRTTEGNEIERVRL